MAAMVIFFIHCSFFIGSASAQLRVEYFFDEDPGLGKAAWMNANTDAEGNFSFQPSTDGLSPGNHLFGFRAYLADDGNGNRNYGPTITQQVFVPESEDWAAISRVEYFWDEDPGRGKATAIAIAPGSSVNLDAIEISTESLTPGTHLLGLRAFGSMGWGPTLTQQVYVAATTPEATAVSRLEYFWDEDPGFGNGTPLNIAPDQEVSVDNMEVSTEGLSTGDHQLYVRAYGYTGWGPTIQFVVRVQPDESEFVVNGAEYFWDEDPGFGKGTPIAIADGQEVSTVGLGLSVDGLSVGEHQLFVRYRSPQGWSPTLATDVVTVSETDLKVCTAEYFWNEDPGFGHGTPIALTPSDTVNLSNFNIPSSSVHGDATLFIRYRGPFGWSPTIAHAIMVDAEGSYTLNANAETSLETRNYQSLADAVSDFADRGVGNNITLDLSTTDTDYQLDATSDEMLAQLTAITESIGRISTPREGKSIGFKAAEGSGNTLTVTTTAEGLPTVVELFARTSLTNVTLTINGTPYDFTASSSRSEETCTLTETSSVALSAISDAVTASWQAVPHEDTVLSGFPSEGIGDLPAMSIINSSTQLDSIAFVVTLGDEDGQPLSTYTYYIYIHPRLSDQILVGQSPATGSSLDPGEVILAWNAVGDAIGGYQLTVSSRPSDDVEAEPSIESIDTDATSYTMTATTGYTYTWSVKAIGYCDEAISSPLTFSGRLLPDLVVESIASPEAAEAGNTITVTAAIRNLGPGATIEGSWKDRLYYTIDNSDFSQAVLADEQCQEGNLAADGSYEVTFSMRVPAVAGGAMHFFVVTDATAAVMESSADNNYTMSAAPATLTPFYINTTDLAALRKFYSDFGGSEWNGMKWNAASEIVTEDNWSGVTFDANGRVTAIDLHNRTLMGTLSAASALCLPSLTTLDLSHNALTGDVSPFVASPELTSLNLSYNRIREVSSPLPSTIRTLDISRQVLSDVVEFDLSTMIDDDFLSQLPTIVRYNHENQGYDSDIRLNCRNSDGDFILTRSDGTTSVSSPSSLVYKGASGENLTVYSQSGPATGTAFQMKFSFPQGDATFNGVTDILDLQATINYMFNRWNGRLFNYAAVNLFPDDIINIQDAIRLVDVLINEPWHDSPENILYSPSRQVRSDSPARLYLDGDLLKLHTTVPIAALDIVMSGCNNISDTGGMTTAGMTYNTRLTDSSMRLIAYSFGGGTLPVGETELGRVDGECPRILHSKLSDTEANEVAIDVSDVATGVSTSSQPVTFRLFSAAGVLVTSGDMSDLTTTLDNQPPGIYILRMSYKDGRERQSKIRIESR